MVLRPEWLGSLCSRCRHVRIVRTPKGSQFLLCERSRTETRYVKYPPQPVLTCPGFRGEDEPHNTP